MADQTFTQSETKLSIHEAPVIAEADVVVVGAGPGGFGAAMRAARMGASTIVVEKYDAPGGVHTAGLQGAYNPGVGGVHAELMERLVKEGQVYTATEKTYPQLAGNPLAHYERKLKPGAPFTRSSFNPETGGSVMSAMLDEAGVRAFYGSTFLDVALKKSGEENSIQAIVVQNKSGIQAIRGKIFVDGTGTAELVARAGAPFNTGGGGQPSGVEYDGQSRPIPGGLLWIMSGISFDELAEYQRTQNDPALGKLMAGALAAGDLPRELYRPRLSGAHVYGDLYIGHPTVDMSPIQGPGTFIFWQNVPYEWGLHLEESAHDAAYGSAGMRRFIDAEARFLRKYVPGFKDAFITNIGRYLGIRDGRHPLGKYVFSLEDALSSRQFADAVTGPMTKSFHWDAYQPHTFQVPYRCFLPQKIPNLLLTGASLSFSYETIFMVMRNFPWCVQSGEIAGFAAAESIKQGILPDQYQWTAPLF